MRTASASALLVMTSLLPALAAADEQPAAEASSPSPAPAAASATTSPSESRLEALEKKMADLQEQNKSLASQVADLQENQTQGSAEPPSDLGKTKVFGFFDTSFEKIHYTRSDSILKQSLPVMDASTFLLSAVNVYLGNQITQHLKFLSELRFTYQPLGQESSTQTYFVMPNGSATNLGTKYVRTDTSVLDPSTAQKYRLGGVSIERAQASYVFNDYLGVTAGYFLTPYGIWNVDHGSPVILMTRAPIMQTQQLAPLQQLGLQLFGRAYLADSLSLDYAGTISNGRGPMDTVADLDSNKGVGLRWRLNYEGDNVSVSLGQYGYTGKYTDVSKALYVGPGSADYSLAVTTTNQYTEYVLTNDLLIKLFGLRLQSEAVVRRVKYNVPPAISPNEFNGNPAQASSYYSPSFDSRAVYGLLAYELPESITSKVRLTPFVYLERFVLNDASPNLSHGTVYSAGLNIKPYPSIVFKLEYDHVAFDDSVDIMPDGSSHGVSNGNLDAYTTQLAVTF